jgi:DNA-binding NtrC family response regulator
MADTAEACLKVYSKSLQYAVVTHPYPYDAVILDYNLPDRDGIEVAKEILAINPHERIILTSGNVDIVTCRLGQVKMPLEVLQKPVPSEVLVNTIEDKEIYDELERLAFNPEEFRKAGFSHELLRSLLDILKKVKSLAILCILTESAESIGNHLQHVHV